MSGVIGVHTRIFGVQRTPKVGTWRAILKYCIRRVPLARSLFDFTLKICGFIPIYTIYHYEIAQG